MPRDDAYYGLTPREWLDSDPVPLTPDVDFQDPEQRSAWIRANLEEMGARELDLQARRARGRRGHDDVEERRSSTTTVTVRLPNAEHRALVRLARRESVTVSDLVRRWTRAGFASAEGADREQVRRAEADVVDATILRITDELRRLRELVATPDLSPSARPREGAPDVG